MKTSVQYNDFTGSVSADLSDFFQATSANGLDKVAEYFKLDVHRFNLVGLSIYGTDELGLSLRCVDLKKSTDEKEFIVDLRTDLKGYNVLDFLFKRLHISLHSKYDKKYLEVNLDADIEGNLGEY